MVAALGCSRSFSSRILIFADTSQRAPGGARIFSHARAMSSSDDPANVDASRPSSRPSSRPLSRPSLINLDRIFADGEILNVISI